jgi:hypothetical protein
MPSYFFRNQQNGFLVTDHKVSLVALQRYLVSPTLIWREKEVVFQNGIKKNIKWKSEIKIGFVPVEKPEEFEYQFGDEVPFSISDTLITTTNESNADSSIQIKIYFVDFDDEEK